MDIKYRLKLKTAKYMSGLLMELNKVAWKIT